MLSSADFKQISNAISARDALSQVRNRQSSFGTSYQPNNQLYRPQASGAKYELKTLGNQGFLSSVIGKNKVFKISSEVKPGSLLEFTDSMTGIKYYGKVASEDNKRQTLKVDEIKPSDVNQYLESDPTTKIYELRQQDVEFSKSSGILKTLMGLLDPSENILFKLITLLLIGNMFKSDSITDIFFGVYIRVVGLSVLIISIMYLTTLFVS